jgi:hypothetical protein
MTIVTVLRGLSIDTVNRLFDQYYNDSIEWANKALDLNNNDNDTTVKFLDELDIMISRYVAKGFNRHPFHLKRAFINYLWDKYSAPKQTHNWKPLGQCIVEPEQQEGVSSEKYWDINYNDFDIHKQK